MLSQELEPAAIAVPILFRPAKRRKIFRHQRTEDAAADEQSTSTPEAPPTTTSADPPPSDDDADEEAHIARLRHAARKRRGGGVAFRASGPSGAEESSINTERSMVLHRDSNGQQQDEDDADADEDSLILGGINRRFAPQTGLVGELVNRHMEEYVESELRKRVVAAVADAEVAQPKGTAATTTTGIVPPPPPQAESQRVMQGKLLEIDLGDEARARNIEMTERARRRLQGLGADSEETAVLPRPTTRLGPDGKPWRGRKRRGSEDIKRDQLVEEFLSENSLGIYDVQPEQRAPSLGVGDDEMAADDRIAEEFRRDFMDAVSRGRRRKAAPAPAKPGARKDEEVLKGPKLGGSRNARAAMRDLLLKEQEMKKQRR
ncbi:hypothetical protein B0T18DRAFT_442561 [Schizothecium vesticola]|uniref:mRNA splicing factor RNA helicase n=1 Tax=Schizothecium vesticola TaxID=314040 RepID=A0AA40FA94_9PEZI|nr:hypothetical protein B0T18DRAFT_442561 [Schizothecium vesticola]